MQARRRAAGPAQDYILNIAAPCEHRADARNDADARLLKGGARSRIQQAQAMWVADAIAGCMARRAHVVYAATDGRQKCTSTTGGRA